ncbi:Putative restriction-modification system specificity determinant [Xenorhabdus bovienii str. oregonense]|uniref:Putative restriction-modification system specificity determinant n=1 Tax=Xenorhabdus bovienii str. oregonense TaxID=1398202 RepID=A0A077NXA5_XENBV|nr:restriction endonuclease subunit S [Xenorhabdus bovienii]CDH06792.1 Putative restriction-modification system specificity determinant [Xenorhabdus bovienii str. oregonense]
MIKAPLSVVAEVIRGVSFSKEEGNTIQSEGKLPVIRAGSIQDSLLLNEGQIWVPKEKIKEHQKIRRDDIVMCTSSGSSDLVGKCAKSEIDFEGSFGAFCAGIRPIEGKVSASYLYHFLSSPEFRNWTKSSSGANIKNIRISELAEFEIPLPPLTEQKRIAAILDKADAIRRKRQQAIQLADEFLRAVFLDMFGDPVTNPKGWEVRPLVDGIKSIISGWSAKGESYPCNEGEYGVLKISAVTSGKFNPQENKFVYEKDIPADKKLVFPKKGDLLFSRANTRDLVAATCIVPKDNNNVFLPDKLWNVKTSENILLPEYLNYLIWEPRFKEKLTSQATGTSGSMLNISKGKFETTDAIFPDLPLQKKFRSIYWGVQKYIDSLNASLDGCDASFSSLSQKAFSGEI